VGGLAALLGHDAVAAKIGVALRADRRIKVLQGPPGVGKTWIVKALGGAWEDAGGCALVATGDALQRDRPLYPLNFALAALAPAWRAVGRDLAQAGSAGERLAGSGGVLTAAIQTALKLRPSRVRARKLYLGEVEQTILFDIGRLAKGRPILLICDNLHCWDAQSIQFLGRLREERMAEAFPHLADLQVLGAQTLAAYQGSTTPDALAVLLRADETTYFDVPRPPRAGFDRVLVELGALPDDVADVADALYGLTGGHLALAASCAAFNRTRSLRQLVDGADDDQEFVRELLVERLRALGAAGQRCLGFLQVAATLGLTFRRHELVCASGEETSAAAQLLHTCRSEDLIELVDAQGAFTHDVFRQHFLSLAAGDSVRLHEAIGSCLRKLRPDEYDARCLHALGGEDDRAAAVLAGLATLQRARHGLDPDGLPAYARSALEAGGLAHAVESLRLAMEARDRGDLVGCVELLDALPHLPKPLTAEADVLRAGCLVESRNEIDRLRAVALLSAWDGYEDEEPELGLRLLNEKLYALSLDLDQSAARGLELRIRDVLLARNEFDPAANDALHVHDRCSGRLEPPEKSLTRVRRAAAFFAPPSEDLPARRPIELYWALSNLVAKQITNVRYIEAVETSTRLERLIDEYADRTFPRLDFPRSNAILAGYRAGVLAADEARLRQGDLVRSLGVADDPFYAENALAVYELLSGRSTDALARFASLHDRLSRREQPVASLAYLIGANGCAARFVTGDHDGARREWAPLAECADRIPYAIRPFLTTRHRLLEEVMATDRPLSAVEFDVCLLERPEVGPQWDQLGRGFRMPEVEWWH
jgi:hypothetical protein